MLLNLFITSIFFALWNILFTYSLKFTELSTSIFLSNLLLMVLVAHKRFIGKSHGLSEVGMSGATWMALGVAFFLVKNLVFGDGPDNSTSFFTLKSPFGEILALSASVMAAIFFKKNYDSHSKLPKYSTIIIIMSFTFVNTLIIKGLELLVLMYLPFESQDSQGTKNPKLIFSRILHNFESYQNIARGSPDCLRQFLLPDRANEVHRPLLHEHMLHIHPSNLDYVGDFFQNLGF